MEQTGSNTTAIKSSQIIVIAVIAGNLMVIAVLLLVCLVF
jgi:hypothetical protein